MLLALFDAALSAVDQGLPLLEQGDVEAAIGHRCRIQRIVLQLIDGLDLDRGPLAGNMQRLYLFVLDQIRSNRSADWDSAGHVLNLLRDGFLGIQDEARQLEFAGEIPGLSDDSLVVSKA